jgi:hypothetical protein
MYRDIADDRGGRGPLPGLLRRCDSEFQQQATLNWTDAKSIMAIILANWNWSNHVDVSEQAFIFKQYVSQLGQTSTPTLQFLNSSEFDRFLVNSNMLFRFLSSHRQLDVPELWDCATSCVRFLRNLCVQSVSQNFVASNDVFASVLILFKSVLHDEISDDISLRKYHLVVARAIMQVNLA